MGKWFKTKLGEVYGKCGLTFGAEPIEVSEKMLESRPGGYGIPVGERLAADDRLMEVPAPKTPPKTKPTPTFDEAGQQIGTSDTGPGRASNK